MGSNDKFLPRWGRWRGAPEGVVPDASGRAPWQTISRAAKLTGHDRTLAVGPDFGELPGGGGAAATAMTDHPKVEVRSREALRRWLEANHCQLESIWLVTYKRSAGPDYVPYDAVVEEALAFGWVDSLPRKLDARRTMLRLSPRKPGSGWSAVNKARIERLIAEGLMSPAGQAKIDAAKRDGSWTLLDQANALEVPDDLAAALAAHEAATDHFTAFPPSTRRAILEWIAQARTPETRARRIADTAEKAARNVRANQPRQPKSG